MTAPESTPLNVAQLAADVEKYLATAQSVLAFVDKFANFLPEQYRTPLEDLIATLSTVNNFLQKV